MCGRHDLTARADMPRWLNLGAGADMSGRLDLAASQYIWMAWPLELIGLDSTWLLEPIRVDGSTWPPEPICLDDSTWPPEQIRLDGSTWLLEPLQPICLDGLTWPHEPIHLDGSTWLPEPCLDGSTWPLEQYI